MVTTDFSHKLVRTLELELLKQAGYKLPLVGFELIMLMPIEPNSWSDQNTLVMSSRSLNNSSHWELTYKFLLALRQTLTEEEYLSIFSLNILEPESNAVRKVKSYLLSREDGVYEVPIGLVGGVTNQTVTVINSNVLNRLSFDEARRFDFFDTESVVGKTVRIEPTKDGTDADVFIQKDDSQPEKYFFSAIRQVNYLVRTTSFATSS